MKLTLERIRKLQQHNFSINTNQNASLPEYDQWLDNQAIPEEEIDDLFLQSISVSYGNNHKPSRYTEALEQVKRQHERNLYPKLKHTIEMSIFGLLTKEERHGYSRQAVAIARLNYVDAMSFYLQAITPATTLILKQIKNHAELMRLQKVN